jgi:hypothetical protein
MVARAQRGAAPLPQGILEGEGGANIRRAKVKNLASSRNRHKTMRSGSRMHLDGADVMSEAGQNMGETA